MEDEEESEEEFAADEEKEFDATDVPSDEDEDGITKSRKKGAT